MDFVHKADQDEQEISVSPYALSATKRTIDLAVAGVGLLLTGILFPVVSLSIRLNSPGPVLYKQARLGLGGKPFILLKFRTMRGDAGTDSHVAGTQGIESRITGVGRVLRKVFIDELPQSWNILRGEMSVVGPRPYVPEECEVMRRVIPEFDQRHSIRPGITGLAQLHYEHVNEGEQALRKLNHDIEYVRSCSFGMDVRIMARTAFRVLGMKGT